MSQFPASNDNSYSSQPSSGMAITSLVLGILGCIPLVGIAAVILGAIAMRRAKADPQRFGGFGLALGGVIAGTILTLASCGVLGVMIPALGTARQAARHVMTQSNLRQIGFALNAYSADFNGAFPETAADWEARLYPKYVSSNDAFRVRNSDDAAPAKFVYLPGSVMQNIKNPSSTILVYESNPRPWRDRVWVLYADGHVDAVSSAQLELMLNSKDQAAPAKQSKRPAGDK